MPGGNRYWPRKGILRVAEYPNDRDGGKPLRSRKRDPSRHDYVLMTVTGKNRYSPGMNPTRHDYVLMTVMGENRYSPLMNSTRYAYTQMTVTGGKTGIVQEKRSPT